jgi:hypothetical protein
MDSDFNNFDMNKIMPLLRSFGVSPQNLGPDKLARLQQIPLSDFEQITPAVVREVLDIFGVSMRPNQAPIVRKNTKVGRNDPCPCGSGLKYKKCCGRRLLVSKNSIT